jgi:hypothetical protein
VQRLASLMSNRGRRVQTKVSPRQMINVLL